MPESLTEIAEEAFRGCESIVSVNIPDAVTSIGSYSFMGLKSLEKLTIGSGVKSFGGCAFTQSPNITIVTYKTTNPTVANPNSWGVGIFDDEIYGNAVLYMPDAAIAKAKTVQPWMNFSDIQEIMPNEVIVKLPGGNMHLSDKASGLTMKVKADENYLFHSASLDDEDVTHLFDERGNFTVPSVDAPSVLNVVFKKNDGGESSFETAAVYNDIRVTLKGKIINIWGKESDCHVRAYDINGVLLADTLAEELHLDYSGIVILCVGNQTFKFAL